MADRTCAERIKEHYEYRNIDLEEIYDKTGSDDRDIAEEGYDELHNFALSMETYSCVRIDLSTGGPGDWLEVIVDDDDDIRKVTYHFNDWFDHASMPVDSNSYLWQYASDMIQNG